MREQLIQLRQSMKNEKVDASLIPSTDFHGSEYVNDYFKVRAWLSGFTGSSGTLLVTDGWAGLWTDGRYFLQAEQQLEGSGISLMRTGEPGVPSLEEYIKVNLQGAVLACDGRLIAAEEIRRLAAECRVRADLDLAGALWKERPEIVPSKIYALSRKVTGETAVSKLTRLRAAMEELGADYHLLTSLEEIAWLFNLRGNDIQHTPVFFSFALISREEARLYVMDASLQCAEAKVLPYQKIYEDLASLPPGKILLSERSASWALVSALPESVEMINRPGPVGKMKAVKNQTEIAATRRAHIKDGAAMAEFICWLKQNAGKGQLTEIKAADYLESCRSKQPGFCGPSFSTIAGYAEHGAIVHYCAVPETDMPLSEAGFLLVDSGGQYEDGTTDITRTIALGPLSEQMKVHYTAVLRGHIRLAMAKFPQGTDGESLDAVARGPLTELGIDFNHGTGHGVGHMLSVHEGPQAIAKRGANVPFEAGMITSNEPGYYLAGEYGIRLENEMLCVETEDNCLAFDTITFCPFERDAILADRLLPEERKWLNDYHQRVFENLAPLVGGEVRSWLEEAAKAV